MNDLYVVQLEAKPGLLAAVVEEARPDGGRESRRIEIPLRTVSPKQRSDWRRLAARSALGLHRLIEEAGELATAWPEQEDRASEASLAGESLESRIEAAGAAGVPSVPAELPLGAGTAAWELAAAEAGGGPEVWAALDAAARAARTRPAFGLVLAGVDPGELADEALAAWSAGWEDAGEEDASKAGPRAAPEGGGREIAEWIAAAAENGLLHEHGRLPDEPKPARKGAAPLELAPCDFSLLPDAAPAAAALAELRRAMHARLAR